MLLYVYLIIIAFTLVLMLLGLAWESYPIFVISTLLCFILAGVSMVIQIPTETDPIIYSDDVSRVFFSLFGILNALLAVVFRLHTKVKETLGYDDTMRGPR